MKKLKTFEYYERTFQDDDDDRFAKDSFDVDFKSSNPEELDDEMTLIVAKYGIDMVRNWLDNN